MEKWTRLRPGYCLKHGSGLQIRVRCLLGLDAQEDGARTQYSAAPQKFCKAELLSHNDQSFQDCAVIRGVSCQQGVPAPAGSAKY